MLLPTRYCFLNLSVFHFLHELANFFGQLFHLEIYLGHPAFYGSSSLNLFLKYLLICFSFCLYSTYSQKLKRSRKNKNKQRQNPSFYKYLSNRICDLVRHLMVDQLRRQIILFIDIVQQFRCILAQGLHVSTKFNAIGNSLYIFQFQLVSPKK